MLRRATTLLILGGLLWGALWLLPRAIDAVPGRYLVRLQQYPVTARVLNWIRPIPATLPTPPTAAADSPTPRPAALLPTPTPPAPPRPTARPALQAASATPNPTATPDPTPIPATVSLTDVPVVWQDFSNCGPANLSILLAYLGADISQQAIAQQIRPNEEDRNVTPWELSDYVNHYTNLRASAHSGGDLALLRRLLAAGLPVTIQRGYDVEDQGWFGHYLTLYGYDAGLGVFYSRDTSGGPFDGTARVDAAGRILSMWRQFNYNFVVVYAAESALAVAAILGPKQLDAMRMWQHSATLAEKDLAADSDDAFNWYNLGVNLTHLGDLSGDGNYYTNATRAFDQARQLGLPPRLPFYQHEIFRAYHMSGRNSDLLWLTTTLTSSVFGARYVEEIDWYHALALMAAGDTAGAREFLERARRVNPHFTPAQASLDALNVVP